MCATFHQAMHSLSAERTYFDSREPCRNIRPKGAEPSRCPTRPSVGLMKSFAQERQQRGRQIEAPRKCSLLTKRHRVRPSTMLPRKARSPLFDSTGHRNEQGSTAGLHNSSRMDRDSPRIAIVAWGTTTGHCYARVSEKTTHASVVGALCRLH